MMISITFKSVCWIMRFTCFTCFTCLRGYVLYVLTCLRTYMLYVLTCFTWLRAYVVACLRAYVLYVLFVLICLRAYITCFNNQPISNHPPFFTLFSGKNDAIFAWVNGMYWYPHPLTVTCFLNDPQGLTCAKLKFE